MSNVDGQTGSERVDRIRVSHNRLCALVNRCIRQGGIIENIPEMQAIIESLATFEALIPVPAPPETQGTPETQGATSVG